MKQDVNRYEVLEKITPLIENTAVRFNLIPIEIEFVKEIPKTIYKKIDFKKLEEEEKSKR